MSVVQLSIDELKSWSGTYSSNASIYCPIRAAEGYWTVCSALSMVRGMTRMCRLAHGYWASHELITISLPSPVFNVMSSERGQAYVCREEETRQLRPDCGFLTDCDELCVARGVRIFYTTNCIQYCIGTILFGRSAHRQCFTF